jgi:hypothetical protein
MIPREEARKKLTDLGVVRWDTNPPADGRIRWFDASGKEVAAGRYQVILSVGPGAKYTMGWAIPIYASMKIPFVPKVDEGPSVADVTADAEIWQRAEAVGSAIGAEFVYNCSTLLVAVTEFSPSAQA